MASEVLQNGDDLGVSVTPFRLEASLFRFGTNGYAWQSDWNHGNAHFLRGVMTELLSRGHQVRVYEPEDAWSRQNLVAGYGGGDVLGIGVEQRPTILPNRLGDFAQRRDLGGAVQRHQPLRCPAGALSEIGYIGRRVHRGQL